MGSAYRCGAAIQRVMKEGARINVAPTDISPRWIYEMLLRNGSFARSINEYAMANVRNHTAMLRP
jgi:hypothetical protein